MPADLTPATRRVTVQRIAALCAHYARMLRLAGWRFACAVVPSLKHQGDDAWAVVDPDPRTKTARVSVRDIDRTPIPGFDGDPMLEIRVTIAHELLHCVVAEAIGAAGGVFTIPAEERIVETAAQAMVRSEGLDARVMARAVCALPSALRARIAASAGRRARGGQMDEAQINEALEACIAGDMEKCQQILKAIIAALAVKGAGGTTGEAVPESVPEPAAKVATPAAEGSYPAPAEDARRAKGAEMDKDVARARKALLEGEAEVKRALEIIRPAAKTQVVTSLRARTGRSDLVAAEEAIMAAPDLATAEMLAGFTEKLLGGTGSGAERARSNIEHGAPPAPKTNAMPTVEALRAEGFSESWLIGYPAALRSGPDVAAAYLAQGRESQRARVTQQNGGK